MQNIEIVKVTLSDIEQLQKISRDTFYQTFSEGNTKADMSKYLEDSFSVKKLTSEINQENSEFYFAKNENNIVGYLKINFGEAQSELKNNNSLEIERIYIEKEFQGKKIGQCLFAKASQIARENKVEYIWLGVWNENESAINFYKKNGFLEFDKHIFKLGNDEQTDLLMKLKLEY
jgi:diamine N-acetyltransferase